MHRPPMHRPLFDQDAPLALTGKAGDQIIPACATCGQPTERAGKAHRVCADGHRSVLVTHGRAAWLTERWEVRPCA